MLINPEEGYTVELPLLPYGTSNPDKPQSTSLFYCFFSEREAVLGVINVIMQNYYRSFSRDVII